MLKKIIKLSAVFLLFLFITGIFAFLTISYSIKNEGIVVVPELVGRDVVSVLEQLSDLGLNTRVAGSEYTPVVPRNFIISQDPEPGTIIKEGRDVRIIFSKGPKAIAMPSLLKMQYQDAGASLDEIGLKEGNLACIYSETSEKNQIIAQFPSTGTEITKGSEVDLLISRGKRPVEYMMRDLSGFPLDDAIFYIEKNGFSIGEIRSADSDELPLNTVTAQNPEQGTIIQKGSRIDLVINRKSESAGRRYVHDAGTRLFRYRTPCGFLKKHVTAQLNCYGKSDEILNKDLKPGQEVWLMIPYNTEATLFLYEDSKLVKTAYYQ